MRKITETAAIFYLYLTIYLSPHHIGIKTTLICINGTVDMNTVATNIQRIIAV